MSIRSIKHLVDYTVQIHQIDSPNGQIGYLLIMPTPVSLEECEALRDKFTERFGVKCMVMSPSHSFLSPLVISEPRRQSWLQRLASVFDRCPTCG